MNTIRTGLIAVLLLHWLAPAMAGAGEVSFTDAWKQVQEKHDGLAADRAGIETVGHRQQEARRHYYPKVDLSVKYTRLDQPVELGPGDLLASMPDGGALGGLLAGLGRTCGPGRSPVCGRSTPAFESMPPRISRPGGTRRQSGSSTLIAAAISSS